ncbi:acyl-CoA reductase-like NAD-dependent aldehyde dehydrogenase [Pedobacter cryoconitis]|uniref:Acyl-CoA reductase-like NAD-dependent aldehyde dehydrogenase n=1 Tax=Pedobacter cryoconitis TaxID=188932 RepID=A0A7W9E183_9SPHI|nr:aldehyde dehydrogenase family protein [Pedobacter cryoconitis]MBB5638079.1 acyl-CoA reductase-like NAD-dependent aldehyde dehydrogenase [Pedobacter cryoconitis]
MNIINPATEEIITTLQEDNEASLNQKIAILKKSQEDWAKQGLKERTKVIQNFYDLLDTENETLAAVLTSEVGKPLQQSRNEINGAKTRIQWMLHNSDKYLSDELIVNTSELKEIISYDPLGVICNISAWNYPYLVGVNVFIPALLAGNAVMYKPSEYASLTGLEIERLLKKAGVPDGVFQIALGAHQTGELLLDLDFDGYFFTGSYRTGQHIYQKVAAKMVPCQLELGGKDPLYVTEDVKDINAVAIGTADGAFYNNGQSCCAVERIYVHEKIYEDYISAFNKELKSWKIGSPTEKGVYIGSLTRKEQLNVLEQQVEDAVKNGAVLLTGGKRINGKGYNFEPTILVNVSNEMKVMQEESFGPIIGIMKVKDDAEAIRMMQDTEYGLTASVYSASMDRAQQILSQIDSGTGYWNCCDRVSAGLPWSGRKHSGIGATLSHQGLRAFTKPKAWHLRNS